MSCAGVWRSCGNYGSVEAKPPMSRSGCLDPYGRRTQKGQRLWRTKCGDGSAISEVATGRLRRYLPGGWKPRLAGDTLVLGLEEARVKLNFALWAYVIMP